MGSQKATYLDEPRSLKDPVGSRSWSLAVTGEAKLAIENMDSDAKHAAGMLEVAREQGAWKTLGYASFDLYVTAELGIDESFVLAIEKALHGETIAEAIARAKENPLPAHGEIGKGRDKDDNIISNQQGTSTAYTLRRFARDASEENEDDEQRDNAERLLQAIEDGEMSVNAAAIEMGYRKKLTDFENAVKYLKKCSKAELINLREFIQELITTE